MSVLWWMRTRGLWKRPDESDWLGLTLVSGALQSKSLIQFFADRWDYVPSLCFGPRSNNGRDNGSYGDFLQKNLRQPTVAPGLLYLVPLNPQQSTCPTLPLETPGYSQASLTHFPLGSLLIAPGSWNTQGFVCDIQESFSQFCGISVIKFW